MSDTNAKTMTPAELAVELETDSKTVRRFLRSVIPADSRPGKGARWSIQTDALDALKTRFAAYSDRTSKVVTVDDLSDVDSDDEFEDEDLEEV